MQSLILFAVCLSTSLASFSANCRNCICQVESGCNTTPCPGGECCCSDVTSESCGAFQIKDPYWQDCNQYNPTDTGSTWRTCACGMSCSNNCVGAYMARYGTYCTGGTTPTCEDYSRIHNGGPNGCNNVNTIDYWDQVRSCCISTYGTVSACG